MTPLTITPDVERAPWTDLAASGFEHGMLDRVGLLRHGTDGGKASVAFVVRTDDGRYVVAETTWALLRTAYTVLAATPIVAEEVIDP